MFGRLKIFGLIILVLLVALTTLLGASRFFIDGEFIRLEDNVISDEMRRASDVVRDRVDQLDYKAKDWARWDDTYQFVTDQNQEYVESNLGSESLQSLNINFMLFYGSDGNLAYHKSIDIPSGNDIDIPKVVSASFTPGSTYLDATKQAESSGILSGSGRPVLFAARPILTSEGQGPARGTLVFAKFLDDDELSKIRSLTSSNVTYYAPTDTDLPPDVEAAINRMVGRNSLVTTSIPNDNTINGYALLKGDGGAPILALKASRDRQIYTEAHGVLAYYMVIVLGVVLASTLLAVYITAKLAEKDKIIKLKDDFFSMASHEIRTPLAAIKGNSQLLDELYAAKNDASFKEIIHDMYDSSERLIRLVTNFLDAARIEQDRIPITPEMFVLKTATQSVVDEMKGIASEKNIAIICGVENTDMQVFADKDRVKQVLYNLIGNALKFTDQGSITLKAEQIEGGLIKVYVCDTGRGVSPEGQKALFEKFTQVKASDAHKGSGLGLYITKILIQKMGGSIALESSAEGVGTTISFTLPQSREIAHALLSAKK